MSKEEYEKIIKMEKDAIFSYMEDIKIEAKNIQELVVINGDYYQNTNKQKIIDSRMENLIDEMTKLENIIRGLQ